MILSSDQSFLFAGAVLSNTTLVKLSSSDGSVLASYSTSQDGRYYYILVSDSRALCFTSSLNVWF